MSQFSRRIHLAGLGSAAALALLTAPVHAQQAPAAAAQPPSWYAWTAKSTNEHPWKAPQKPVWRLSEILSAHQGKASWSEQIVLDHDYDAKYIQMAAGAKTRTQLWADDRIFFVVWGGQIRFTIQGQPPILASKGFLVQVPYRTPYSMETVGSEPSLRFEVVRSGRTPVYPLDGNPTAPAAPAGKEYVKVRYMTPPDPYTAINKPFIDFEKDYAHNPANPIGDVAFVKDDDNFMNIIRGRGFPTPPDSAKGHFHADYNEFWFIAEGTVDYKMEGMPVFTAHEGDVVYAPQGRFHRATWSGTTMDTRIAINPRPEGMHNFEPSPPAKP